MDSTNKREISKLRKTDERAAAIINRWLEENFYTKENGITEYSCIDDVELQVKGIDTIFVLDGQYKIACDEKAAVQYINKPLNTFAFELSFIDRANNTHDGWLLDSAKTNDAYLIVWIDKTIDGIAETKQLTHHSQLENITAALVMKQDILNYLDSLGWTAERLRVKTERMRRNPIEYQGNIYTNGCKFCFSKQLVEKPVNLLISRKQLLQLSIKVVTK